MADRDWPRELGLHGARELSVGSLDEADVADLLAVAGVPEWAREPDQRATLMQRTGGDPFYLRFLVDALTGRAGRRITSPAGLAAAPDDLEGYLREIWGDAGGSATDRARVAVLSYIDSLEDPPLDAHDVYLRLHLLSHRLIRPNEANLDGIFGTLNNVVWTTAGPCAVEGFEQTRLRMLTARMTVQVLGIDKFPRMVDYVVPSGVRIADGDRVRLGAHLGEGTVVMQVGYINFNAGTLGTAMVEGRISQGTVVDEDSDLGAGSSLMGTLSGGGKEVVRLGKRCLIGANGGVGISLGDDCVVESGLYITAGTQVTLPDGQIVKAVELSGRDQLMFIRNSTTGVVEVRHREQNTVALNPDLHAND